MPFDALLTFSDGYWPRCGDHMMVGLYGDHMMVGLFILPPMHWLTHPSGRAANVFPLTSSNFFLAGVWQLQVATTQPSTSYSANS